MNRYPALVLNADYTPLSYLPLSLMGWQDSVKAVFVEEELSVDLKVESIKPYGVFRAQAHGKPEGTMVRMTCFTAEYSGDLKPSEEGESREGLEAPRRDARLAAAELVDAT